MKIFFLVIFVMTLTIWCTQITLFSSPVLLDRCQKHKSLSLYLFLVFWPETKCLQVPNFFFCPDLINILRPVFALFFGFPQLLFLFLIWVFLSPPRGLRLRRLPPRLIKFAGPTLDWNSLISPLLPRLLWLILPSFLSQLTISQCTLFMILFYLRFLSWLGSFFGTKVAIESASMLLLGII